MKTEKQNSPGFFFRRGVKKKGCGILAKKLSFISTFEHFFLTFKRFKLELRL